MNRKQLIAVVCILIISAAAVSGFAIFRIINNNSAQSPVGQPVESPSSNELTPENNENGEVTEDPKEDEINTKPIDSVPAKTDEPSENTDTKPDSKPDIQYNTTQPQSYKDFALTKGMDAKTAYEYLNSFLSSKYSILINKQNKVGSDYAPSDLLTPKGCQYKLESVAADALVRMLAGAKNAGYSDLILYSGYRTYASQKSKYDTRTQKYLDQGKSNEEALELAGQYIAPPGSSEHHTGLAADICSAKIVTGFGYLDDSFDKTKEFKWLTENCADYGFILRYRKDAQSVTGFLYEPWHYRYIGIEHAKACTALNITYEEYHSMLVKLRDEAKTEAGV